MRSLYISLAVCFLLFLTACSFRPDETERGSRKARSPLFEVEATVISLSLDANEACQEKCPGYEYPLDTGLLRIEKILSVQNPDNVGMAGYEEGDEINVAFIYSARPARVEYLPTSSSAETVEDAQPEIPVSAVPTFAEPIPIKDGYFNYRIETSTVTEPSEQNLPGVQEGSKIRVKLFYGTEMEGTVAEYGMIN